MKRSNKILGWWIVCGLIILIILTFVSCGDVKFKKSKEIKQTTELVINEEIKSSIL